MYKFHESLLEKNITPEKCIEGSEQPDFNVFGLTAAPRSQSASTGLLPSNKVGAETTENVGGTLIIISFHSTKPILLANACIFSEARQHHI